METFMEEIYIHLPFVYTYPDYPTYVCHCLTSLYGLKQPARSKARQISVPILLAKIPCSLRSPSRLKMDYFFPRVLLTLLRF